VTAAADFGDPIATDGYALCLYDGTGGLALQARAGDLCDGSPCWRGLGKPAGSKGFKYRDRDHTPDGLFKVKLLPGADGRAKILVTGKDDELQDLDTPRILPLTVQVLSDSGVCWEAVFDVGGVIVDEVAVFKGKGD
jgi:hypothetical protein